MFSRQLNCVQCISFPSALQSIKQKHTPIYCIKTYKLLGKYNSQASQGERLLLNNSPLFQGHGIAAACLLHSIPLAKMLILRIGGLAYTLKTLFPCSGLESPGGLGKFSFGRGKRPPLSPYTTPPSSSFSLLQLGEASRQSELIAAHSGKSSLVWPHMVTRCVARRDSRARHPEESSKEIRLEAS